MKKLKYFLIEMRPKQWVKNVFLFPALVFSKNFNNIDSVIACLIGFLLFCLASSSVYIVNDIIDRKKDMLHPKKSKRPIASGMIKIHHAVFLVIFMLAISIFGAYLLSKVFLYVIFAYILNSFIYSVWLKNEPIIDIMSIAVGFVIRTLAGAVVINVEASPWLLLCTSVLCLFLAANKRRAELEIVRGNAGAYKATLGVYTKEFLDNIITICISLSIVLYSLYCYFIHIPQMMITIVFVIYCLFRYQLVANLDRSRDNVEMVLFKDKPLLISIMLWGISCFYIVLRYY